MTSSKKLPQDRRTISCPSVSSAAKLEASVTNGKDAPPDYNSLPRQQQTQLSPTYSPDHHSSDGAAPSSNSPAARTFFSAIKQQVRSRSRSLSCSREPSPSPASHQDGSMSTREQGSQCDTILGSQVTRVASPTTMSPQPASPASPRQRHSNSLPVRPSARRGSRSGSGNGSGSESGTYTQCGRHSNEWLFHNISFTETVKGAFERRRS